MRTLRDIAEQPAAVAAYRRALPEGETLAFAIDPLDVLGVPTWSAELFARDGSAHHGIGFGETDGRALIGAFGELSEVLFSGVGIRRLPRRRASYAELLSEVGPDGVVDPLTVCLTAGSGYGPERPLDWVPATRHATGEPVLVPLELAAASPLDAAEPEDGWLVHPITNGLGAGPTVEHALLHGLLETIQRDGNSSVYRALDKGVRVSLDAVESAWTRALLDRLEREGVEVQVKLAATDFGTTNLYVAGSEKDPALVPHPLMLTAGGESADPDKEKALSKALTEFCASRSRKVFDNGPLSAVATVAPGAYVGRVIRSATREYEEERALNVTARWLGLGGREVHEIISDPVFSVSSEVPFSSLPAAPPGPDTTESTLDYVAGKLREEGLDPLFVDLSPDPGDPEGEVRVVKAIVPGLEVETASYGRIGARNAERLLGRTDGAAAGLVGVGDPPPGARPIPLPESAIERLGGRPWLDVAALQRKVDPLYPLYREPSRHVAALVADGVL